METLDKIEELSYIDIVRIGDNSLKYLYALKKATPEERERIFKDLGPLVRYDNPSHDGIPFYLGSFSDNQSADSVSWIDRNGNIVADCPFKLTEDGNIVSNELEKKR